MGRLGMTNPHDSTQTSIQRSPSQAALEPRDLPSRVAALEVGQTHCERRLRGIERDLVQIQTDNTSALITDEQVKAALVAIDSWKTNHDELHKTILEARRSWGQTLVPLAVQSVTALIAALIGLLAAGRMLQ
jgi:hypothetical protein